MEKHQVTHQKSSKSNEPWRQLLCRTAGSFYQSSLPWLAVDVLRKAEDLPGGTHFELVKWTGCRWSLVQVAQPNFKPLEICFRNMLAAFCASQVLSASIRRRRRTRIGLVCIYIYIYILDYISALLWVCPSPSQRWSASACQIVWNTPDPLE